MYILLIRHLPRPLVHLAYLFWYAGWIFLVLYFSGQPEVDFYYLHGG